MRINTDQLIRTLAADTNRREPPVRSVLATALAVSGAISTAMFFASLGFRNDIETAIYNPFFDLKFLITIALAVSAFAISLHLSRPEASLVGWKWMLLIPVGLLALGLASEMVLPQRLPWITRMIGTNSKVCTTAIPLLSLPILVAALVALRHGAPARPALAGAFAGLLSAGFAATLYASQCIDDSPLFVATWYSIAIAMVTTLGALAGNKLLRS